MTTGHLDVHHSPRADKRSCRPTDRVTANMHWVHVYVICIYM